MLVAWYEIALDGSIVEHGLSAFVFPMVAGIHGKDGHVFSGSVKEIGRMTLR